MAEVCSRQFSLRHLKHETKVNQSLYAMLVDESLVDVIVSTDGTNIRAHRLILSANSSYFKTLFDSLEANRCQIPIVILKDVPLVDLKAIIEFMYRGEVCVEERHLSSVLKSAELLKVNGLTEVCLALRSRLNSERLANTSAAGNDGNSSSASDQTILRKRPRISDDLKQTPQTTDLFSRLSNARFEIRPSALSPNNSRPKASSSGQSVVKNIVIPSNQIHNKKASPEVQSMVNRMSSPSSSSTSAVSATHNSRQNSPNHSFRSPIKKTNTPNNGTPDRVLTSTWTPSQSSLSQSVNNELSSNCSLNVNSFVEVLLDDETPEQTDDEIDIKPPIFELNQRLAEQMAADSRRSDDPSPRKDREPDLKSTDKPKPSPPKTTATARTVAKAGRPPPPPPQSSVKSRSSSTSSQSSLPPPPNYRVVQRSSSRLLRNLIKPTASMPSPPTTTTNSSSKAKESDDRSKSGRLTRQRTPKVEAKDAEEDGETIDNNSPEIECPSCGLAFNDEQKWNEHIVSAHMSAHT